jgi:hypothetical protein
MFWFLGTPLGFNSPFLFILNVLGNSILFQFQLLFLFVFMVNQVPGRGFLIVMLRVVMLNVVRVIVVAPNFGVVGLSIN